MSGNILLIVIDQFRADCLDGVLAESVDLPNIRALMRDGVTFRRHSTVTTPCGPSRASLLTGLYAMNHRSIRNGTPLEAHHPTIATEMRKAGYEPLLFGYTDTSADPAHHHPNDPALTSYEGLLPGFAETVRMRQESDTLWRGFLRRKGYDLPDDFWDLFKPVSEGGRNTPAINDPALYSAEDSDTAFLTDRTLEAMSERRDRPWFAMVTYIRPHPPLVAPAPYNTMIDPASIPEPFLPDHEGDWHPFFGANDSRPHNEHLFIGFDGHHDRLTREQIAALRSVYLGLACEVDAHIGRLLAFLDQSGQTDDTLVVLTADHGEMLGDHGLWGKAAMFDGALRIPLIIRDPRRRSEAGKSVEAFSESIDIAPTLLDWLDAPAPPGWNGRSLVPFLEGRTPENWRRHVFAEIDLGDPIAPTRFQEAFGVSAAECGFAVLQDRDHKYVHFNGGIAPMLYAMAGEQPESTDLARQAEHRDHLLHYATAMLDHRMTHSHHAVTGMMLTSKGVARA